MARGVNYGTCFEIALKIRELSGLLFEAYSAADLMHGPVAAIGQGWPVLAVAPSGPALASMRAAVDDVARAGRAHDRALRRRAICSQQADVRPAAARRACPEWLSPLVAVVAGQLAAIRLARLRGVDVDNPLGLSKVTLTR